MNETKMKDDAAVVAAERMFNQHHGDTAKCRPWSSIGDRERIYWTSKARIAVGIGFEEGRNYEAARK